jgi:uncharacterized protein (DUF1778 family)
MASNLSRKEDNPKDDRIQLRIPSSKKEIIAKAAKLENKSLSKFVLDQAYEQAQRILSDNGEYILTAEQWEHFMQALEAPPKDLPNLRKLFAEPSIFVEE